MKTSLSKIVFLTSLLSAFISHTPLQGATEECSFKAFLLDVDGNAVSEAVELTLCYYDKEAGGTVLEDCQTKSATPTDGLLEIGFACDQELLFNRESLFVEVQVNGSALSPRVSLQSVPYAKVCQIALGVAEGSINSSMVSSGAVTTTEILDGTVSSADIGNDTIGSLHIAADAVGASEISSTGVTAGSYGSATQVGTFTVDADGRLTAAGHTTITGVVPGGSAGGELTGTYPNPSLADDIVDFSEMLDSMNLDATTTINLNGSESLVLLNTGTGNTLVIQDQSGDTSPTLFDASGNVGIGDSGTPRSRLHVVSNSTPVATLQLTGTDGSLLDFMQDGIVEGNISVAGSIVSYNAFTGSHYAQLPSDSRSKKGMLVTMTGKNTPYHGRPESEVIYGAEISEQINDPAILGSYLTLQDPAKPQSVDNPHLIMAVGNGVMWVVDTGKDIQPGDYLISSSLPGHAEIDQGQFPVSHIIAKAAEIVDWGQVTETTIQGGAIIKHKLVSVLFGSFALRNFKE